MYQIFVELCTRYGVIIKCRDVVSSVTATLAHILCSLPFALRVDDNSNFIVNYKPITDPNDVKFDYVKPIHSSARIMQNPVTHSLLLKEGHNRSLSAG